MSALLARCLRCPAHLSLIAAKDDTDLAFTLTTHASSVHFFPVGAPDWMEGEDYQILGDSTLMLADGETARLALKNALWVALNPHLFEDPEAEVLKRLVSALTPPEVANVLAAKTSVEAIV